MRLEKTATTTFNCPQLHRVASSLLQFFIMVILTYALAIAIEKRSYYTPQDCRESGTCDVKIKHEEKRSVISSSNHTDTGINNNNNNNNSSSSTSPHHYFCPDARTRTGNGKAMFGQSIIRINVALKTLRKTSFVQLWAHATF